MPNDPSTAELEADFAAIARVTSDGGSQAGTQTTLLHFGDEQLVVLSGQGDPPESASRLDLGAARLARTFFHHDPPTALEIERGIDFVEDELMRLGPPAQGNATLWNAAPALRAWRTLSGSTMTIDIVESWFQRLAAASLGQAGAMQGLPAGGEPAAVLLVLREFMHHRGHASIVVVEPPAP